MGCLLSVPSLSSQFFVGAFQFTPFGATSIWTAQLNAILLCTNLFLLLPPCILLPPPTHSLQPLKQTYKIPELIFNSTPLQLSILLTSPMRMMACTMSSLTTTTLSISLAQIVAADQALWQKVAQETRGSILTSGDPEPVQDFMDPAEVTYHLLPIRDGPKPADPDKPPKPPKPPRIQRGQHLVTLTDSPRIQRWISRVIVQPRMMQIRISALHTTERRAQSGAPNADVEFIYAGGKGALASTLIQIAPRAKPQSDRRRASWMWMLDSIQT